MLYRRADEVDPNMGRWKAALTGAYQSFAAVSDTPGEKIRYLEMGLALAPNPPMRRTVLPDLAQQYLMQGSTAKAQRLLAAGRAPVTPQLSSFGARHCACVVCRRAAA